MVRVLKTQSVQSIGYILGNDIAEAITGAKVQTGGIAGICGLFVKNYLLKIFATHSTMQLLYD
jgi:hypothetical protein